MATAQEAGNNCGPVLGKINENDLTLNSQCHRVMIALLTVTAKSPENVFDIDFLLRRSHGPTIRAHQPKFHWE